MAAPSTPHVVRLGNTTFPVKLIKTCADPKDVSFEKAGPHGSRLVETVIQEGRSGAPARTQLEEAGYGPLPEGAELKAGVWLDEGRFVDLSEHVSQIDAEEKLDEMEVLGFIRREQVPLERVLGSYWMAPGDGSGAKILKLIHGACRTAHRCPVIAWTKKTNRSLGVVVPLSVGALLVLECAFAENYRGVPGAALSFQTVEVTESQQEAMTALVAAMSERPDLVDEVEDDRRARRRELMEFVKENGRAPRIETPVEAEVSDELAEALEAALA